MSSLHLALILVLVPLLAPIVVSASAAPEDVPHVRPLEPGLQTLVERGVRASPLFRALVDRINHSDVVVYIKSSYSLRVGITGQMTFLGASAGRRYVVVSINGGVLAERQLATIGHELMHVVEVAETPAIVDSETLVTEYGRFGHVGRDGPVRIVIDTDAAIDAGRQVWRDVVHGAIRGADGHHSDTSWQRLLSSPGRDY